MIVKLTPAQTRVLPFVREGLAYAVIATRLGISVRTVKNHVYVIADKIGPLAGVPPFRRVQLWALKT